MSAATPLPFSARCYRARLARVRKELARAGAEAMLLTPSTSFAWVTGLTMHRSERLVAAIVPRTGAPVLIGPAFEIDRLRTTPITRDIRLWQEHESPIALVAAFCRERRITSARLLLEPTTEVRTAADLARALGGKPARDGREVFVRLRPVKSAEEVEKLRGALAIARAAYDETVRKLKAGMREEQVGVLLRDAMTRRGGVEPWTLVQFGPTSAIPHALGGARKLAREDAVLLDFGCACGGYQSDLTRSFWFGKKPPAEYEVVRETVVRAFSAGLAAVRPGATAESIDAATRGVIEAAGYGPYFTHRTGHGLGMDIHEEPYIVRGNGVKLAVGNVFTIEPGIYLPGRFGVRHENDVRVTAKGGEVL